MVEVVYKFDEKLLRMFEKVSRSLKYDSNIFFVHKHIYIWTPQPITLPRSRCACRVTRRSVEHSTPHTDGAPLHFTGLSYILTFYLLPMLEECGRGSISLQFSVTYQVETDQCKRSFDSVKSDLPLFLLTSS